VRTWGYPNNDQANSVAADASGVYVAGTTFNSSGSANNAFVLKYDGSGSLLWKREWGGAGYDVAFSVAADVSGVYVAGFTAFGAGNGDAFLLKFSKDGNILWNKTWGGAQGDSAGAVAVDGTGVYLAGSTSSYGTGGNEDAFVLKYDLSGAYQWNRTWGSGYTDIANAVVLAGSGIYVGGTMDTTTKIGSFLLRYEKNGSFNFPKKYWGNDDDVVFSMAADPSGIYTAGRNGTWFLGDATIKSLDFNGNVSWNTTWGGLKSDDNAYSITAGGSFLYASGQTNRSGTGGYDTVALKYDTGGNLLWNKTWGGAKADSANSIAVCDSHIYIAGFTDSFGSGKRDAFVLKTDLDGGNDSVAEPAAVSVAMCTLFMAAAVPAVLARKKK
jgi:hypothetical protein